MPRAKSTGERERVKEKGRSGRAANENAALLSAKFSLKSQVKLESQVRANKAEEHTHRPEINICIFPREVEGNIMFTIRSSIKFNARHSKNNIET